MEPDRARRRSPAAGLPLLAAGLILLDGLADGFSIVPALAYQMARRDLDSFIVNSFALAGTYLLCVAAIAVVFSHASRLLRFTGYALTLFGLTLHLGLRATNGYGLRYHEGSMLASKSVPLAEALPGGVWPYISAAVLVAAILALYETLGRRKLAELRSRAWLAVPLLAGVAAAQLIEHTQAKVYQLPIPLRVPLLVEHTARHRLPYYGPRAAPLLEPVEAPLARHLLLVVDESISAGHLHLLGGAADTTPFLDGLGERLLNYGVVSATSNVSSNSNLLLQSGLRIDQVPDRSLRSLAGPNLFSYMQRAGFSAHLIDAQIYSQKPANLMTGFDLQALDGHHLVRVEQLGSPEYEMDMAAVEYVARIVESSERSFVYLNKAGAHFPYDSKYPPEEAPFQPILGAGGEGNNLAKTLGSYRNALRWTVDGFVRRLFERFEGSGVDLVVVYTADHGQSIAKAVRDRGPTRRGRPKAWPHSTPVDPPLEQAAVPLLLFAFDPGTREALAQLHQPERVGTVSAFEVFPTLLHLAGYDPVQVREHHHASLFDAEAIRPPRRFVSGNLFGVGGHFYMNRLLGDVAHINPFDAAERPLGAETSPGGRE